MKNKSIYLITTHNGQYNFSFSYQGQVFQGWIFTKFPGFQRLLIWLFGVFSRRKNYQTLSMSLCKHKWQSVLNPTIAILPPLVFTLCKPPIASNTSIPSFCVAIYVLLYLIFSNYTG